MTDSPTINSVVFTLSYKDADKSLRQSTARGINTPDRLIVQSQPYKDSTTKVDGTRYALKIERHDVDANLQKIISTATVTFGVPSTVTTAQFDVLVATLKAAVAHADYIAAVLNNEK
jgi:hypothetical protein